MKTLIILLILATSFVSINFSQTIQLNTSVNSLEDITPKGWQLLSSSTGDLNNDGIEDIALVIENTETSNFKLNKGLGIDTINLNPRILAIYFGTNNHTYEKQLQADSIILLRDIPTMDEPFDSIAITNKGTLTLDFHFWFSAGSWLMSSRKYTFRYQHDRFELIGFDYWERHRGSGNTLEESINFSTKKIKTIRGEFEEVNEDGAPLYDTKWFNFELNELKSLQSMNKLFEWEHNGRYF